MGRMTTVITFKAPPEFKEKLEKYSEMFGVSVSEIIRVSIERYIKEREEEMKKIDIETVRREIIRNKNRNNNNNEKKIKRNMVVIEI